MSENPSVRPAETGSGPAGDQELVTCVLDQVEFGLDIHAVQEIVRLPRITPVPKAPPYVEGVANLRGNILPIINSRNRFGMKPSPNAENHRVVVVELGGQPTGLIVDAVREVMHVQARDMEPAPEVVQSVEGRFLKGIVKLDGGRRLVLVLDHNALLEHSAAGLDSARAAGAEAAAEVRSQSRQEDEDHEQLVTFRLADEEYAVSIMEVQEIIRVPAISVVPDAPPGVVGVASLRNRILPVMDLRSKFGLPPRSQEGDARHEDERCLVVRIGGTSVALRVDAVHQVLQAPRSAIEPTPRIVGGSASGSEQIRGIVKLDSGRRLIMLLDVEKLVDQACRKDLQAMTEGQVEQEAAGSQAAEQDERQLVSFKVAGEEFAVDIMQVQEIVRLAKVTKVPHAPAFVEGVVNLRGNVLPVIDLRKRVHLPEKDYNDSTRVVVVDQEGRKTGIIVDSVSEVLAVKKEAIEPAPEITRSTYGDHFIEGVGKLHNGERMFLLLRTHELLREDDPMPAGEAEESRARGEPAEALCV